MRLSGDNPILNFCSGKHDHDILDFKGGVSSLTQLEKDCLNKAIYNSANKVKASTVSFLLDFPTLLLAILSLFFMIISIQFNIGYWPVTELSVSQYFSLRRCSRGPLMLIELFFTCAIGTETLTTSYITSVQCRF